MSGRRPVPAGAPVGDPDSPLRRAVDVAVAIGAGAVLAPLLAVIGLAVRWRLGPPVLFRQERAGKAGRPFTILKFRTMRAPAFPSEPDADRLAPLGRALRASSLDELPQLWNLLVGDMTVIGPRPTLPEQVSRYDGHQRRRLDGRPGITGWAQVHGRNAISWADRIELDVWYLDHRSLPLDLRVLARTLLLLVRPRGVTGPGGVNDDFGVSDGAG